MSHAKHPLVILSVPVVLTDDVIAQRSPILVNQTSEVTLAVFLTQAEQISLMNPNQL